MKFIKIISHLSILVLFVLNTQEPVLARSLARSWFHPLKLIQKEFHPVKLQQKEVKFNVPTEYSFNQLKFDESMSIAPLTAHISWREFFSDPYLINLIEKALANNQEFNIFLQDIEISRNEVKEKQGEYLPKVGLGFGAEKYGVSKNTRDGMLDKIIDRNDLRFSNSAFNLGPSMTWELDIWKKLRNAKDAARIRLMAQYEGRNYLISRLVGEIARSYYELMALDNSLKILDENIEIQNKAFLKMKALKEYARSNNLAVNRFEAQLLKTKSERFEINQKIVEKENRLKFLSGIYDDTPILRNSETLMSMQVDELQIGVPTQLLENRPDIRQAEYAVKAAKLDLKSVQANLYPSLSIKAGIGFSAFNPALLFNPKSLVYNLMGDIMAPLINRKAIIARIAIADSYQTQTVLNYEQTLLQAYTEVLNQMSNIKNIQQSFDTKQREVHLLDDSVDIANSLFQYAKADYVEVLLTQEEKLNAQKELVELKMNLIGSKVDLYRALGGGWR
ncbi:MAG: efflux system, outer rane lipoprotein NodT family [Gammaproteobacteria bacterium]|jgi:NodT family efflux transporter outer membrane factor (OMF) lipoprotein|nr:efflux system, outer rane lipoprotein NodT family [Gammaproteobacteria bacterium]